MAGNPAGNRPLGRRRHSWENIQIGPTEVDWEGKDIINLAQDREKCWIL